MRDGAAVAVVKVAVVFVVDCCNTVVVGAGSPLVVKSVVDVWTAPARGVSDVVTVLMLTICCKVVVVSESNIVVVEIVDVGEVATP